MMASLEEGVDQEDIRRRALLSQSGANASSLDSGDEQETTSNDGNEDAPCSAVSAQ